VLCTDVVSVSTSRSRAVVSKRLGLVSVSRKRGKVSASISSRIENQTSQSRTIGSRLQANMHSFLLHCKIALHHFECKASICLLIHEFTYLRQCKCMRLWVTGTVLLANIVCYKPSPVRLSVTLSRLIFWQCFYVVWYLGHTLTFVENFTKIVPGEPAAPPSGALNSRGLAKYSDFGPIEGHISETVQDRRKVLIGG